MEDAHWTAQRVFPKRTTSNVISVAMTVLSYLAQCAISQTYEKDGQEPDAIVIIGITLEEDTRSFASPIYLHHSREINQYANSINGLRGERKPT